MLTPRAAVVHLNFRAGSTFPVPVCTVPSSMDRTSRCNKVDVVRLYASNRLNFLLLKGQICLYISNLTLTILCNLRLFAWIKLLKGSVRKKTKGVIGLQKKKRFWSLLIFLLSVESIRRKLLKTAFIEERSVYTNSESWNIQLGS